MTELGFTAMACAGILNQGPIKRDLQELRARQEFVVKAVAAGLDKADAEQLLIGWPNADAEFILKAHIMGVDRGAAVRILADAPRGWADWALEWETANYYRNLSIGTLSAVATAPER